MPKTKISEFSSTPANNTDIDSINIAEGCAPSGINDAIRELMSQLKDWQSGTSNDPMVIGSSGSLTLNQGTANGVTYLNGSKVVTSGSALTFDGQTLTNTRDTPILVLNDTAASNSALRLLSTGGISYIQSGISGGSFASLAFTANGGGSEQMRLTSTGLGIGTSSPAYKLTTSGSAQLYTSAAAIAFYDTAAQTNSRNWIIGNIAAGGYGDLTFSSSTSAGGAPTTQRMTLDYAGNLGLGVTPSAWGSGSTAFQLGNGAIWKSGSRSVDWIANGYYNGTNYIYNTTNPSGFYRQQDGQHQWWNAPSGTAGNAITFTQAMTLDASGNLGVGTTSPARTLDIRATSPFIRIQETGSGGDKRLEFSVDSGGVATISAPQSAQVLTFNTVGSERARIDSSGNLLVGATSSIASERLYLNGSNANYITRTYNSNANPYGALFSYTGAAPNGTANEFFRCDDTGAVRMTVRSNGGIANYSANNVNLSDERTKTNIQNAGGYLAKICAIPVRTFKYKDQSDDLLNLGVIAQEVETVAPELVDMSGFGETPEDGIPLKAIYQTDLQYALMKCIQEQQAIIESLKARLDAANL